MKLYDGSSVDWFYFGWKTADEMRQDERFKGMFEHPAVLYDDGEGRVYRWEPLQDAYARMLAESGIGAEAMFEQIEAMTKGEYVDPASKAEEAATKADQAKATADTAAVSVNEYMDALLGLDTTNETEATDAE